jgi:hypothetical protein
LAEAHGGLVKVKWAGELPAIQPGEIRTLTGKLSVPKGLRAGRTYAGNLELPGLVYPVRLELAGTDDDYVDSDGDDE